jgi:hypothetical protein
LQRLEGSFQVAANKSARGKEGMDKKAQNDKFVDIVRRQNINAQGGSYKLGNQSINYDQIRKQWISDLKAFGVFQQNELWQFGQMTEA